MEDGEQRDQRPGGERGPRVVFFTRGTRVPSARFRVEQFVPAFTDHGLRCRVLPCRPSVYGEAETPWLRHLPGEVVRPASLLCRLGQMEKASDADIVFFQRPMVEYQTTLFERRLSRRTPSIFDFDDAIFHNLFGLERFKIRRIIREVSHVVVGSPYLHDWVGDPERTTLIPTVVDTDRYTVREEPGGPFTIGWTGLSSNLDEFRPLTDVLRRVLRETGGRLLIIADRCKAGWLRDLDPVFVPWSPSAEVEALARVHVGIMPLVDTPYNRGKCGFKLIQYMARAIPTVSSPTGVNGSIVRDGVDGFMAGTPGQWEEALLTLARDRERRVRMGTAARERVVRHYSVDAVVPTYLALFDRVLGKGAADRP